jgi:hypothetical protein
MQGSAHISGTVMGVQHLVLAWLLDLIKARKIAVRCYHSLVGA